VGKARADGGVYKDGLAWQRGKGNILNRGGFSGDLPGARRVCPRLLGRDDRRVPVVSG
jgi:hypothetical protein